MGNIKDLKVYNHISYKEYMALDPKTRAKVRELEAIQLSAINPLRGILHQKEQEARIEAHKNGIGEQIEAVSNRYAPQLQALRDQIKELENQLREMQEQERNEISDLNNQSWKAGYETEPELREQISEMWQKHENELRILAGLPLRNKEKAVA